MNITALMPISAVLTIVLAHYVSDFMCQTSWMAKNKSKSNNALLSHVGVYSIVLFIVCYLIELCFYLFDHKNTLIQNFNDLGLLGVWVLINGTLHFVTDYFTSRKTSKLFAKDWHRFFEVVGFDQLIHYFCLFYTYTLLFPVDTIV